MSINISIITPSYNQAEYLENAIQSVLSQDYPALEYIVMDGGSTDRSTDIIRRYEAQLAYWVSEKDHGMYDAIDRGFSYTTGEIMGWLNSDDVYFPWTFEIICQVFNKYPQIQWLTTMRPVTINAKNLPTNISCSLGYEAKSFYRGYNLGGYGPYTGTFISQAATFWRRSLWEEAGSYLDKTLSLAGDFELWARFFQFTDLYSIQTGLAAYRRHGEQKSVLQLQEYYEEAISVLKRYQYRPYTHQTRLWHALAQVVIRGDFPGKWILKRLLDRKGLLSRMKTLQYRDGEWCIRENTVVT